jgi:hypothetical protein
VESNIKSIILLMFLCITENPYSRTKLYNSCYSCMNMNICYHIKSTSTATLHFWLFWSFYLSPPVRNNAVRSKLKRGGVLVLPKSTTKSSRGCNTRQDWAVVSGLLRISINNEKFGCHVDATRFGHVLLISTTFY